MLEEGIIAVDSDPGKQLGFTSDKFDGNSYLWFKDGCIWISFIRVLNPGHGHFSQLIRTIRKAGYTIKVPTPFPRMEAILKHYGFDHTKVFEKEIGESVDVWVLTAEARDGKAM